MPYIFITRQPYNIVIESPSLENLYKYIHDITNTELLINNLDQAVIEQIGSQAITNEAMILKNAEELLNFEIDYLTIFVNADEATKVDWSGDLSNFYLDYFKWRAFNQAPDLSELKEVVKNSLELKAEFLDDHERLKLYKDIIQRRFSIKAHEEAFENMATLPNF